MTLVVSCLCLQMIVTNRRRERVWARVCWAVVVSFCVTARLVCTQLMSCRSDPILACDVWLLLFRCMNCWWMYRGRGSVTGENECRDKDRGTSLRLFARVPLFLACIVFESTSRMRFSSECGMFSMFSSRTLSNEAFRCWFRVGFFLLLLVPPLHVVVTFLLRLWISSYHCFTRLAVVVLNITLRPLR